MSELLAPQIIRENGAIFGKYIGDMMKALANGKFEGRGIRWHDPDRKDLQGEWFSSKTYTMRNAGYPVAGIPVNYQHGLHKDFGNLAIGLVRFADEDEFGLFIEGELKTREEYIEMLKEIGRKADVKFTDSQLAQKSALMVKEVDKLVTSVPMQFSGGFDPSTWIVNPENNHIDQAGMIHLAFTPTPADDLNPMVRFKSALTEVLKYEPTTSYSLPNATITSHEWSLPEGATLTISTSGTNIIPKPNQLTDSPTGRKEHTDAKGDNGVSADNEPPQAYVETIDNPLDNKGHKQMSLEEMLALLRQLEEAMTAFGQSAGASEEDATMMAEEVTDEMRAMEEDEEELKGLTAEAVAEKAYALLQAKVEKHQNAAKVAKNAFQSKANDFLKRQPAVSQLPAYTGGGNGHNGNPRISVSENLKWAHLSAMDRAMAWKMAVSASPFSKTPQGLQGRSATDFVSEDFYRHAVHAMAKQVEQTNFRRAEDALYIKSIAPIKASELDATDITGQGLEYLGNTYDTMVWETARNNQIYQLMLSRGMMEKPVPQGMKNAIVPVEGNDPSVYGGVEGNSTDATGRPEVVYKITPQTTSTVTVTPGTFRTATAYTFELGEDSFVDMASEANRKVRLALEEHIEKAMINADSETAANTNINDIAGTPTSTGLTRDYFLEFDGLRKSPLVTSTAYSRSGGTLAVDDYRRTWALLGSTIAPRKDSIFFLIDFNTFQASLDLLPTLTKDVAGENAALFTGEFDNLWGIPIYMSGFLALSNTAGKIDLDTPGNNTKGQIMAIYAPYWAFVFKRNINIEMQRSPDSETFEFYGSMRFSLKRRSADAAAISYNLTV